MSTDTGPNGPRFCFDSRVSYLHLLYSKGNGHIRRSAIEELVTATQETTLQLGLRPQSSGVRDPTGVGTEPNGVRCARRHSSDTRAAMVRWTTMIYEERQRTVKEMLCDTIQRYYYEWGEQSGQAEGTKVVLFFSFSTETTPEEIVYRRVMVTMTTTTAATTMTTRLTTD
ncbi:hypothetical protein M404DRAFT_747175 [Pisolithus tinctorius Marx 270]|uniref:Uncharacterized protein n=1 Tax=Pisolithus tinctorius Marx 270 TaxID=870435 RepID=A0A0C3KR71_PISTI|nr:hypothetical protein M404DRAFT_747175 [Pisolithus tinctorius Marx 270]